MWQLWVLYLATKSIPENVFCFTSFEHVGFTVDSRYDHSVRSSKTSYKLDFDKKFYNVTETELKTLQVLRFWDKKFTSCQILNQLSKHESSFDEKKGIHKTTYWFISFRKVTKRCVFRAILKEHDSHIKLLQQVRFSIEKFEHVRFRNKKFTTCQILNKPCKYASHFQLNNF